jgi:hypothetical protein
MEWIVLAIAMLIMAPAAALPFIVSANDSMERDALKKNVMAPTRVQPVVTPVHPGAGGSIERTAA